MKQFFTLSAFIFCCFISGSGHAQLSSGFLNAVSVVSDNTIGTVGWSAPFRAQANDASRTTSTALLLGDDTEYLMLTGFNLNIPAGMVITGIEVQMIKSGSNGLSYSVTDNEVRMVKAGVVTGSNLAVGGKWPSSDQTFTYGSATENWGTSWTAADVNDPNFGVAVSAHLGGLLLPTARVNFVSVNISYDVAPLPVTMLHFDGKSNHGKVDLSWATATETNNQGFTVERSVDGTNWENIGEVLSHTGNSVAVNNYSYTDVHAVSGNSYYRLRQTDIDNSVSYTKTIAVNSKVSDVVSLYPNPANDIIHVAYAGTEKIQSITLSELSGRAVQHYNSSEGQQELTIYTSDLPPGEYLISMASEQEVIYQRIMVAH